MSNLGQQRLTASHKGIGGEAWSLKPQRSRSGRGVCQTCLEPGSRKEDSRPKPQLKHQHFGNEVETEDPRDTLTLTLSETAQPRSSSVVSNTSTALMADK
ncbi:hypothetical protein HBI56_243080 [Parastagonospora nodorum]|uniref:Uncharacterized protein n=1 Tax=Phaeosphaeria nodorum (strain SN15 / ATCC MYA-4574 / FGSC 10173) TaxID=321614 RepID=Q0UGD0_PHANO|nr:hypothetical protein SNOG_01368 [Parastagonospora nodorum SN15]XP_001799485.1 hypothetical protein SNOG_09184 [Parastagonospora nodorum SN15]KAH6158080.1 hypothetical protein HBI61_245550 [Parastagonospora nodorum]EAT83376.1 hypothetical protein SNOG_09184 [Parastagonospora nodorum SN15]EAT91017.1 hypothetical protein SNOG_01368 [Parastagonospora nodorum SN15]KAH6476940.1 hypothetical protein HBI56_243080 [Parastagonospora nodorum]